MDNDLLPPPNFALPGFAALVELTMAAQQVDCGGAIAFLEQRWAQTGLGGIHPDRDNDRGLEGDDDVLQQPERDAPQPPAEDVPRRGQAHAAQPPDPAPPAAAQPIEFDPDACIATTLSARPADYAIKRIEVHKHVPMWYFSREGLCDAARSVRQADENDTLAMAKTDEGQVTV